MSPNYGIGSIYVTCPVDPVTVGNTSIITANLRAVIITTPDIAARYETG